jgi:hypothetical protein
MEDLERYDIYFVDRAGKREVRDRLPYYGTLDGTKIFWARYLEEVASRYTKAEIFGVSAPVTWRPTWKIHLPSDSMRTGWCVRADIWKTAAAFCTARS